MATSKRTIQDLASVRRAISSGESTDTSEVLAQEIRASSFIDLVMRTGMPRSALLQRWDDVFDAEARLSLRYNVPLDVSMVISRFVWYLLHLIAQNEEVAHQQREGWEVEVLNSLYVDPLRVPTVPKELELPEEEVED